jgi:WD40 repeat protein
MVGLLALATMVLSAASDTDGKEPDLQRALVLARTLNDPSILAEAIVALGWEREREICTKLEAKTKGASVETWEFLHRVLRECRETPLELVYDVIGAGSTKALAFSPNGKWLAIGSGDSQVSLVEVASGKELWAYTHRRDVSAIAFSPDGTRLATGSYSGDINVFDVISGQSLWESCYQGITAIAFSSDGTRIATANYSKKVLFLRAEDGMELREVKIGRGEAYVSSIRFSPDGKKWAVQLSTHQLIVMSTDEDDVIFKRLVDGFAFSSDWKRMVTATSDFCVSMFKPSVEEADLLCDRLWQYHQGNLSSDITFSPDGRWLAIGSYEARLVDAASGEIVREIDTGTSVFAVAFSPDGKLLATGEIGKVSLWRTPW